MQSFLLKNWKIIAFLLVSVGFAVYVIFREGYIAELELKNGAFQQRTDALAEEIDNLKTKESVLKETIEQREDSIAHIVKEYKLIPTDNELQDVTILGSNASWDEILQSIEMVDKDSLLVK